MGRIIHTPAEQEFRMIPNSQAKLAGYGLDADDFRNKSSTWHNVRAWPAAA